MMQLNSLRVFLACIGVATLLPSKVSNAVASSTSAAIADRVTPAVERRLKSNHAVGVAVAVLHRGAVVYAAGFGFRDLVSHRPVEVGTRFEIGSDTKQFTAAAILQLKERGKLSLDQHLANFVPDFPHARELTIRQLLDQTTGLPDFLLTNHFVHISQSSVGSLNLIERLARGPLHFAPGSRWEYSNTNYIALGRIIEVVSRESYNAYIREHLFAPAGMKHTTTIDQEQHIAGMPTGYWTGLRRTGSLRPAPKLSASWTWSAGEIVSTVGDLARWDMALQSGRIIGSADFALMTTPATLPDGKLDNYGFGWWTDPLLGHKHIYHDGDTFGMSSSNNLFPDDHLAVIVLQNVSNDEAAKTVAQIFQALVR